MGEVGEYPPYLQTGAPELPQPHTLHIWGAFRSRLDDAETQKVALME